VTPGSDEVFFSIAWAHGELTVRAIGGMLAPLRFDLPGARSISPLYVAPWSEEDATTPMSGMMRRMRGEWPCVPFGAVEAPSGLPPGWLPRDAGSPWFHGYGANHAWKLVDRNEFSLSLRIDLPEEEPVEWMERVIRVDPQAPALSVDLIVLPRRDSVLPFALHPTFAVPPDGVQLVPGRYEAVHTYPCPPVPGVSRLTPDRSVVALSALPCWEEMIDLSRLPLDYATEELLQLQSCESAFALHYASGIQVVLDWDRAQLPDVLLWISQRGRSHAPWNGRNQALGIEPCNSCFDLSRVATPPSSHPLSHRCGLDLIGGKTFRTSYRISAHAMPDARTAGAS
jgi:hypothetical protein